MEKENKLHVKWYSYVALILLICYLSGVFANVEGPLRALDYSNSLGQFGKLGNVMADETVKLAPNFKGIGGYGVRDGFMLILTIIPGIMLSFGVIELFMAYEGDKAASKLFSPILRPLFGLPGSAITAIVANFSSTDAGASVARTLVENGEITEKENVILNQFMFSAPGVLVNLFGVATPLVPFIPKPLSYALMVILLVKILEVIICRMYVNIISK